MKVLYGLLTLFLGPFLTGLTLSTLWGWFVVPTLHAPQLSIPVALGIALIMSMVTGPHEDRKLDEMIEQDKHVAAFTTVLLRPLFCLLIGAIYHAFM